VLAEVAGSGPIRGDHGGGQARSDRIAVAHRWIKESNYLVADITERISKHAARLATDHDLKGADACVLAVALSLACPILHTWDDAC